VLDADVPQQSESPLLPSTVGLHVQGICRVC